MSMSDLATQVNLVKTKWQNNIVLQRPGDLGVLQAHIGSNVTLLSVSNQIDGWAKAISGLSAKPRISSTIAKSLTFAGIQCFRTLNVALDGAGNGLDWMCVQRGFATNLTLAHLLIREITAESGRETVALTDAARTLIETDLSAIQKGSQIAGDLAERDSVLQDQISAIESAAEAIEENIKNVTDAKESMSRKIEQVSDDLTKLVAAKKEEVTDAHEEYVGTLREARSAIAEADSLRLEAQEIIAATKLANLTAEDKNKLALENLNAAVESEIKAKGRLTKALQSAQMEGLAGSFTRMASDTKDEAAKEKRRFELALVYLVSIGVIGLVVELQVGFARTPEDFLFRLVRTLSLAVPGIWIAWSATRQLGALNRVYSDYQYKSASALAYESYRQTVNEAGDDELKRQLLAFAIRSFGDNPTRYYDAAREDAASPGESWLTKFVPWSTPKKEVPKS